jgi:hypothetical protein
MTDPVNMMFTISYGMVICRPGLSLRIDMRYCPLDLDNAGYLEVCKLGGITVEIEEIGSKKDQGSRIDYSRRAEEVRRLSQSMGAERHASAHAVQQQNQIAVKPTSDTTDLSAEASHPLGGLSTDNSARTSQILSGLEQSFQGGSQDPNQRHRRDFQTRFKA